MSLTDSALRNVKPTNKRFRLWDTGGLYLEVAPAGGKWWRFKYRYEGKEKRLSLGTYPDTGLKLARKKRDEVRELLASGIDPLAHRKATKTAGENRAANSFEVVAREWIAKKSPGWAESHTKKIEQRLENDVYPWLGNRPVADISAPEILSCLRRVEERGAIESAHRILNHCNQVFRYAIGSGRAERNPAADLSGQLSDRLIRHHAAITDPKAVGALLRAIDGYDGATVTQYALKLAPLVFLRPGELRQAEWKDMDLENALWSCPPDILKMTQQKKLNSHGHIVPLSAQALALLLELKEITGNGKYLFPGARHAKRPMSDNTVNGALRSMGFTKDEMTGHGFRAMARTILDEVLKVRPDYIEHQLAHTVKDPNGRAYNRTAHIAERKLMMQQWADYLDTLKQGGNVLPMTRKNKK